jgi:hypothetical protein
VAENVNASGKLPNAQVVKTCISRAGKIEADLAESRGELGSFVKEAEDKHNIHRKAFKLTRQLDRMDPTKLAEFLRHFDHYRKIVDLDTKAGMDMFEEGEKEEDLRPSHLQRNEADRKAAQENTDKLKAGVTQLHS